MQANQLGAASAYINPIQDLISGEEMAVDRLHGGESIVPSRLIVQMACRFPPRRNFLQRRRLDPASVHRKWTAWVEVAS